MLSTIPANDDGSSSSSNNNNNNKYSEMSIQSLYKNLLKLLNSNADSPTSSSNPVASTQTSRETEILQILFDLKFKIEFLNLFSLNENVNVLSDSGTLMIQWSIIL